VLLTATVGMTTGISETHKKYKITLLLKLEAFSVHGVRDLAACQHRGKMWSKESNVSEFIIKRVGKVL